MFDNLEFTASYIIFIPHVLVYANSPCRKSDARRSMTFVLRLASVPCPIFAPSIGAPGIRSTGPSWLMSLPYASHGGVLEPLQLADQAAPDEFLRELRVGVRALA